MLISPLLAALAFSGAPRVVMQARRAASPRAEATADPDYTLISTSLLAELLQCEKAPSSTPQLPPLRNRYVNSDHSNQEL